MNESEPPTSFANLHSQQTKGLLSKSEEMGSNQSVLSGSPES